MLPPSFGSPRSRRCTTAAAGAPQPSQLGVSPATLCPDWCRAWPGPGGDQQALWGSRSTGISLSKPSPKLCPVLSLCRLCQSFSEVAVPSPCRCEPCLPLPSVCMLHPLPCHHRPRAPHLPVPWEAQCLHVCPFLPGSPILAPFCPLKVARRPPARPLLPSKGQEMPPCPRSAGLSRRMLGHRIFGRLLLRCPALGQCCWVTAWVPPCLPPVLCLRGVSLVALQRA